MNRRQRRAATKQQQKPRFSNAVFGSTKQIAAQLKAARPTEVFQCVLKRNSEKAEMTIEPGATDWAWLNDVEREGFDEHAPNGPTYYRVTRTHYYSVFFHPQAEDRHPVLLMTELEQPGWDDIPIGEAAQTIEMAEELVGSVDQVNVHNPLWMASGFSRAFSERRPAPA